MVRLIGVAADLQIRRPVGDGTEWRRKPGTLRISLELLDQAEEELTPQNKSCCADSSWLLSMLCAVPERQPSSNASDKLVRVHAPPIEFLWV